MQQYLKFNRTGFLNILTVLPRQLFFILFTVLCVLQSLPASAEDDVEVFDTITVEGENLKEPDFEYNQSVSSVDQERIEEKQASNVMELLQELPGISSYGGPLAGGMRLSIRGFGNNEDIIMRIDGATQNFEKYRYGNGLSIDPELLKRVTVSRGSAILARGSGALGGVIEMETVDARDLLAVDENWGVKVKYGHRTVNDGDHFTLTAMARPTDYLDFLVSGVKRDTNQLRLPNGDRFPYSEETQKSLLTKVELYNDFSETALTYRFSDEKGLEYLNVAGGTGNRGVVDRTNEEKSYTLNTHIKPASDLLDIRATIAYSDKYILDDKPLATEILSEDSISNIPGIYQYDIWTAELTNSASFKLFEQQSFLTLGVQYNYENRQTFALDGDPKETQPSGLKQSYGVYLTQEVLLGNFVVSGTLRGDKYIVDSADNSKELLQATGRSTTVDFTEVTPAFSIAYEPASSPFSAFYNYAELFRSPLIDEYFTTPTLAGGRCRHFSPYIDPGPRPRRADYPPAPAPDYAIALAQWNALKGSAFNNDKALCADYYDPEQSKNHEIGIAYVTDAIFTNNDSFAGKLTFFYTKVENILESIYQDTVTGKISQPGVEVHRGIELELKYDSDSYFSSLVVSTLDGYRDPKYNMNNPDPVIRRLIVAGIDTELVDDPANKLIFTLGRKFKPYNFRIGYRLVAYDDYLISGPERSEITGCTFFIPDCSESVSQSGYALHDIYAVWQPWKRTAIRLNIDNITNKEYHIIGTSSSNKFGPGRDIRISFSHQF